MIETNIIINMDSLIDAKVITESISPEIENNIPNTKVSLYSTDKKIFININSKNLSSLRAACNSYLRWINTAYNVKKTI